MKFEPFIKAICSVAVPILFVSTDEGGIGILESTGDMEPSLIPSAGGEPEPPQNFSSATDLIINVPS
ncbi:MAG: hypothetical protein LBS42_05395 [Tannerella sp.]|jgi:hypothetical protein|nr:hypothetical protein [Tannerella sp.]